MQSAIGWHRGCICDSFLSHCVSSFHLQSQHVAGIHSERARRRQRSDLRSEHPRRPGSEETRRTTRDVCPPMPTAAEYGCFRLNAVDSGDEASIAAREPRDSAAARARAPATTRKASKMTASARVRRQPRSSLTRPSYRGIVLGSSSPGRKKNSAARAFVEPSGAMAVRPNARRAADVIKRSRTYFGIDVAHRRFPDPT
ncbi:hypothetical protein MTO96_034418 [Rhipicephalus appendiculatus]